MGAFSEFFGFEGRIGRLGYLWRCLAVGLGIGVLSVGGGAVLELVVRPMGLTGYQAGARGVAVGVMLSAMWSSGALASRRLRDMGLEPVHVVPAFLGLWVVYAMLMQRLGHAQSDGYGFVTVCWALLALLLWPGREAPLPISAVYEPPQPTAYINWRENG
jgi:uncharacterized membrane protein YhaH (DUF805 family)